MYVYHVFVCVYVMPYVPHKKGITKNEGDIKFKSQARLGCLVHIIIKENIEHEGLFTLDKRRSNIFFLFVHPTTSSNSLPNKKILSS